MSIKHYKQSGKYNKEDIDLTTGNASETSRKERDVSRSVEKETDRINSINCLNIYGLISNNNRSKPIMLGDMMENYNSYCIFLTETWLNPNIEDAEVHIDGYT